jgi:dermatan 4-sulfotransferase 1
MSTPLGGMTLALGEHYILFQRIPLIYARIPKVANSSVKAALTRLLEQPPEDGYRTTADVMWKKGTHGETTMVDVLEARRRRSSHFIFSFVRNPFDRLVSAYNNKLIENDHLSTAMQRMGLQRHMPFEAFLDVVSATPDAELDVHLVPQSSILCVDGIPVPGFIGQMEAMPEHWQKLRTRMRQAGLPAVGKLPSKNVRRGTSNDLSSYFSSTRALDVAYARYKDDVDLFYAGNDPVLLSKGFLSTKPVAIERVA